MTVTRLILGLIAIAALSALPGPASAGDATPREICLNEAHRVETREGIPHNLLAAISVVETGRWDEAARASFAWPWTVTAEGRGRYFPTRAAAIAEVHRLRARGIANIDVGCMQINLMYHPHAFSSLAEAFEPTANVAYAAGFLKKLHADSKVWSVATARYHSSTPEYARRYRAKIIKEWNNLEDGRYAYGTDTPAEPADIPVQIASLEAPPEPTGNKTLDRKRARAYAETWRAQKLAEWKAGRADRTEAN